MIISHCYLTFYSTSGSSIKSQVLDLKTLPIFSPLKISVNRWMRSLNGTDRKLVTKWQKLDVITKEFGELPQLKLPVALTTENNLTG